MVSKGESELTAMANEAQGVVANPKKRKEKQEMRRGKGERGNKPERGSCIKLGEEQEDDDDEEEEGEEDFSESDPERGLSFLCLPVCLRTTAKKTMTNLLPFKKTNKNTGKFCQITKVASCPFSKN
jgi:hypothetical protein